MTPIYVEDQKPCIENGQLLVEYFTATKIILNIIQNNTQNQICKTSTRACRRTHWFRRI